MIEAVIFDVDGTLCDVRNVRYHVMPDHPKNETGKKDFYAFHSASVDCPPHDWVVGLTHAIRNDVARLVVTSRMDMWLYHTIIWMNENDVRYDELYMRKSGDGRPDYEAKADILDDIRNDGYEPIYAIDDNPDVIRLWRDNDIPVLRVPGWNESHL